MKDDLGLNIFVDNDPNWGGTFQYTENIIESLIIKNKKKVKIFYSNKSWNNKFRLTKKIRIKLNIISRFFFYTLILLFKDLKIIRNIFCSLYNIKNDSNCIWIFPSQDLISCVFPGKKIVAVHDLMHMHTTFEESSSLLKKIYREFRYRKIARHADKIILDSNYGKFQFLEHYKIDKKKLSVLPFFIKKNKIRDKLLINNKYLIYPAKFWKHKNHINLIKAINKLVKIDGLKNMKIVLTSAKDLEYKNIYNFIKKTSMKTILVEGGPTTLSHFIELKLINYMQFIISPTLIGSGIDSLKLKPITNLKNAIRVKNTISKLGKEIVITLNLDR